MKASIAWQLLIVTMVVYLMGWREGTAATHYVVPTNPSAANPYTSWGTAGTSIIDVVNAAMTNTASRVVWVTNGTYALTNQVSLTNAVTVQGFTNNGAAIMDGQASTRCFYLDHSNAVLDGLVITRGYNASDASGVFIAKGGIVQNCTIVSNSGGGIAIGCCVGYTDVQSNSIVQNCIISSNISASGGGIRFSSYRTGIVRDCQIYNNTANGQGGGVWAGCRCIFQGCSVSGNVASSDGGGIYAYYDSNLVDNCVIVCNIAIDEGGGILLHSNNQGTITNCTVSYNTAKIAGGIYGSVSTVVANCTIIGNTSTNGSANVCGGGVYISSGRLENSLIKENRANYFAGGVQNSGGTVRNCLIMNNTAGSRGGGLGMLQGNNGIVQNCTIVSNATTPDNVEGGGVFVSNDSNGTNWFQNCIIYSNTTPSGSYANYCHIYGSGLGSYSNCCLTPALSGASINYSTNNITADPQFVGWTNSNYRLSRNSQCINAGVNRDWMTNAVDFDGHRRVDKFSGRVDIGCYEYLPRGVIFTIR